MRLSTPTARLAVLLAAVLLTFQGSSGITRAEGCTIPPRFGPLVREIPQVVGQCLLNPTSDPSTGDIGQVTTNGELLMRGSDGIAQFTDATNGYLTWVAGPDGVVSRSQDERFEWEAPLASPADAGPAQTIDNENDNLNANELANTNTVDASGGNATGGNANAQGGNSSNANTNTVNPVINVNVIMPGAPASTPTPAILPSPISATPMPAVPTATIALTNLAPPVNAGPSAQAGQWVAWGTAGGTLGSFSFPTQLSVAPDGSVYVNDDAGVQRLAPTDACQCWWQAITRISPLDGTLEKGFLSRDCCIKSIFGITTDASGSVYLSHEDYISKRKPDLTLMQTPWRTDSAYARITIDQYGFFYATLGNLIVKIGPDGKELGRWGSGGSSPGQFSNPVGIAVDGQGNLYVADKGNNRIQKLSANGGRPLAQFGTKGTGPGQLDSPSGVAIDQQGNLWVADTSNHRIQKLSPSGQFLQSWGNSGPFGGEVFSGDQPGQFKNPMDVKIDSKGNVYVADTYNFRIQKLILNP